MKKILLSSLLLLFAFLAKAQQPVPADQPYGKVDMADLEMKSCDFEPDANSEILINKAELYYDNQGRIVIEYHVRTKIFNDNGKQAADIHIPFFNYRQVEYISGMTGETVNLTDGKAEITKLDKKEIFTQAVDKYVSELVFTMPNVKAGSIIEYKYTWTTEQFNNIPTWYFQSHNSPVRYSEIYTRIPEYLYFSVKANNLKPFAIDTTIHETGVDNVVGKKKVMTNLLSLPEEPYMSSINDNLQSLQYQFTGYNSGYGYRHDYLDTWKKVGEALLDDPDFGGQLKRSLKGEEAILNTAKTLKTDDEKIAYLFKTVQSAMKLNGIDRWYTIDGTSEAWDKKTGNSTEINLILYHLIKKAGLNALPMIVSTREHGKVNPVSTNINQFNRAIVYIPVDSTKSYILDASGKYNMYNETPYELLNSSGLEMSKENEIYNLVFLERLQPVLQSVFIQAEIKPNGKLEGSVKISSMSNNRVETITKYKTEDEKKYIDALTDNDNNLKVTSLKMENMDVDTLPLKQAIDFTLDLGGTDNNYIYFKPVMFSDTRINPFLAEKRTTDIDFGCMDNLTVIGVYKMPAGYISDALPKNLTMSMPDNSITFKRSVGEEDGTIKVRYAIIYRKTIFFKENYDDFHEFFKKVYEMLNDQIVLKKS